MERLTYFKDGYWRVNFSGVQYQADFVDRLAAYEDTGLTPEEIKAPFTEDTMINLAAQALGVEPSRLRELAEADKDGRVVVLPCKVYETDGVRVYEHTVREVIYETAGGPAFDKNAIGKSIFLTREEAERASRETQGKEDADGATTSRNEDCVSVNGHGLYHLTMTEVVQMADRLAAYEDTRREPEEVTALGKLFDYALKESKTLTEQLIHCSSTSASLQRPTRTGGASCGRARWAINYTECLPEKSSSTESGE